MAGFGKVFLEESVVPLKLSSESFRKNFLGDGVRRLSSAELVPGLERGIERAAREAGAALATARALLPVAELGEVKRRIDQSQPLALASVRRDGMTIADFRLPARSRSPAVHLSDLAHRFERDRHIAEALGELAVDIADWHRLLHEAASRLDAAPSLRESRRRVERIKTALVATSVVVALATLAVVARVAQRRAEAERDRAALVASEQRRAAEAGERVEALLASRDPCEPSGVEPADAPFVTEAQRARVAAREASCEGEKKERARRARCQGLAEKIARREPFSPGGELDAEQAALLTRIASRALVPSDLAVGAASLPCADPRSGEGVQRAFAEASSASPWAWYRVSSVSPFVAATVLERDALPASAKKPLAYLAEKTASQALRRPSVANLEKARSLCDLKADLGLPLALSCSTVRKLR